MDNVITCPSCRTEYDGSKVEPGARFACVSCGGIVSVSINHNPAAHRPATVADVATAATPELIRGAGSTFVAEPTRTAPPMAANAGKPNPTWYGGWEINTRSPRVRGFGFPIAMTITGAFIGGIVASLTQGTPVEPFAGAIALVYPIYWLYRIHAEHPRRTGIDFSPVKALALLFLPGLASTLFQHASVYANGGLGEAPAGFEPIFMETGQLAMPVTEQYHIASLFSAENLTTAPGIGYMLMSLLVIFTQFRVFSRLTGRLNALRDSLPDGPFARPKRVNENLVKWIAYSGLGTTAGMIGAQFALMPEVGEWHNIADRLQSIAVLPLVGAGVGAIVACVLTVIWWVQTQRLSDSLASQAHYDAQPPVKTNSHAPGGHPNNMV